LFGGSEFFLGGSDRTGYSQQRFSKVGSSEIFLGGSELWNIAVTVLDLGVFIPLGPPTVIFFFPLHSTPF
jgi:hypothetical protein